MSLQNYANKMQNHSHKMESKLAFLKTKKKRGSKGEQITRDFLKRYGLPFKEQVSFNNLYYKSKDFPLRFDFQVWVKDKWFLIEIQGSQHYKPSSFGGHLTEEQVMKNFEEGQERDRMKKDYCESHGIALECVDWDGNKKKLVENLRSLFRNQLRDSTTS